MKSVLLVGAAASAVMSVAGGSVSTQQGAPELAADSVTRAVQASAPEMGPVAALAPVPGGELAAGTEIGGDVLVSEAAVALQASDGGVIGLSLAEGLVVGEAELSDAGEAVFVSKDESSPSAVVRVLQSGQVSVQTVLHGPRAPRSYSYAVGAGVVPVLREDGGVDLVAPDGVVEGQVEPPWAFDADGEPVVTSYEVRGDVIVQSVEVDERSAYPVVADPTFGHTWGVPTLYLNKAETKSARDTGGAQAICGVGGVLNAPLAAFCAGNSYIIAEGAKAAHKKGKCVKLALGVVFAALPYTGGSCR